MLPLTLHHLHNPYGCRMTALLASAGNNTFVLPEMEQRAVYPSPYGVLQRSDDSYGPESLFIMAAHEAKFCIKAYSKTDNVSKLRKSVWCFWQYFYYLCYRAV